MQKITRSKNISGSGQTTHYVSCYFLSARAILYILLDSTNEIRHCGIITIMLLINIWVSEVCNTLLMETWESLRVKENLISVGFQPTTSGLGLPMLCRLSYESSRGAGRGTIEVVNRGECARD